MNGFPFRSSLFPNGDGTHHMMVNKAMKTGAQAQAGDTVRVVLEPDTAPRTVETPPDLVAALATSPDAQARYEQLAYSHKKEYVEWIESAKKDETRARRVEQAVAMVLEGKRLKGSK
jgi:uncharacterized protein YdeI (YjbR/CyaY-like superfamily)